MLQSHVDVIETLEQKDPTTRRPLSSEIFSARTVLQLHKIEAQG